MGTPSASPVFPKKPSAADFARGFSLPFRGFALIFRSGRLLGWSLLSGAVTFVSLIAIAIAAFHYAEVLLLFFGAKPTAELGIFVWQVLRVLVAAVLAIVGVNTLPVLLLAPLQDPLSEATEALCGDVREAAFSPTRALRGAIVSVSHTLARIIILLAGHALLLTLNLIPAVGSVAWGVLSTLWTMVWAAAEYLDAPMARHFYRFREVRQVLWRRKALALGFGAAVWLLLWVPVVNLFFIPVAVIGGTLLFRGLCDAGALRPPNRAS